MLQFLDIPLLFLPDVYNMASTQPEAPVPPQKCMMTAVFTTSIESVFLYSHLLVLYLLHCKKNPFWMLAISPNACSTAQATCLQAGAINPLIKCRFEQTKLWKTQNRKCLSWMWQWTDITASKGTASSLPVQHSPSLSTAPVAEALGSLGDASSNSQEKQLQSTVSVGTYQTCASTPEEGNSEHKTYSLVLAGSQNTSQKHKSKSSFLGEQML